jgi:pimeloyl-ACP methyl ester carboxylesterase
MMTTYSEQPEYVGADFFARTDFWGTFRHGSTQVGDVNLHYVEGGEGAPILLIPGWPQSWYAWRYVMHRLVKSGRRVIAVDPRGMGESDAPVGRYDAGAVAAEIHAFADKLGLLDNGPIDVAAHDVGVWITYALAADWRSDIRRIALLDALVPGLSAPRTDLPATEANLRSWHFAFNQLDELPQLLISGREEVFFNLAISSEIPSAMGYRTRRRCRLRASACSAWCAACSYGLLPGRIFIRGDHREPQAR